jgi:hypothetical protein
MTGYTLYNYTLSLAGAVVSIIAFVILSVAHGFFAIKNKTKFLIAFIIGGFLEAVGYAARAVNAHQAPNYTTIPYALQSLFILLAPSLFAASVYMILGRIIRCTDGDSRSLIRATRLTKIFVLGDVLSFFIQSAGTKIFPLHYDFFSTNFFTGGGLMSGAKSESNLKLGENVIIVGLIVQILFFGFFIVISFVFHKRMANNPTTTALGTSIDWQRYLAVLYLASALIMFRCIYRVVEYIQGQTGFLQSHEYFAYICDAVLMILVMIIFLIYHPSQVIERGQMKMDETELVYGRLV